MEAWKANSLSKAGRVVLIQFSLESLPMHTMQCFQLPKKTTTLLDRVNRTFFWKKYGTEKGLPMVAWDKICQPKNLRGLGLRKTEAVNLAFQAKLAWKVLTGSDGLWSSVVKRKYLRSQCFLDTKSKSTDSPAWKSVLRSKLLLRKGIRWKVGKGDWIMLWWDNWCDNASLVDLLDLDTSTIQNPELRVSDFITQDKC